MKICTPMSDFARCKFAPAGTISGLTNMICQIVEYLVCSPKPALVCALATKYRTDASIGWEIGCYF